jgi:hypothetical protein
MIDGGRGSVFKKREEAEARRTALAKGMSNSEEAEGRESTSAAESWN